MHDKSGEIIEDRAALVTVSPPSPIGRGFMAYERYQIAIARDGEPPLQQQRDLLRASRVAVVLPVDLERQQLVLLRQFRLPAHLVTGRGEMVEIVAGRVEDGEVAAAAAARECVEEIGVAPQRLAELFSVLSTPGITDEYVTFFLASVDASAVPERCGMAEETEDIRPFVVSIDDAIGALGSGRIANAMVVCALQWLALNRARLSELL
ncbi:ADP-ribose pyrophosphatase [Rhodopseudomonas faecalis]|uniref:GDP-mannose pyrophosphatase n=1 Tax=Rhodopseudomonas faecalis TaxID=99655 RepID=A0A318TD53_9BRAD|nr:NUDIX domain-containing protein [Rhodopseudomonas faecalis]PYF01747.1 ADP-ribose pyrophosphatase [Rhodopseudomonas faecalis]TAH66989.1 MAG: NUDIX domain-containing protein [Rhodopseudomonas palustris]